MRHLAALVLSVLLLTGCAGHQAVPVIAVKIPDTAPITRAVTALKAPITKTREATAQTAALAKELVAEAPAETPFQLKAIELEAKARAGSQLAIEAETKYITVVEENTKLNTEYTAAVKVSVAAAKQSAQFQADKLIAERDLSKWRNRALITWTILGGVLGLAILVFVFRTSIKAAVMGAKFGI